MKGEQQKYKGILMASLTAILGIALVGVGIAFWTDWLTSVLLNIGSGLLATSITYFLVLPQMKYQEQEQFRELYEGQGVRDISFSPNQLFLHLKKPGMQEPFLYWQLFSPHLI